MWRKRFKKPGPKRLERTRGAAFPYFLLPSIACLLRLAIDRPWKAGGGHCQPRRRGGWRFCFFRRFTFAVRKSPLIPPDALCMTKVLSSVELSHSTSADILPPRLCSTLDCVASSETWYTCFFISPRSTVLNDSRDLIARERYFVNRVE